ncbi:energy-coupling factor transporter ATPase [Thomasclavelia cocleata]|uniref:energy-coupling factor transporter ATPase n=1 Tax=Thomasclavelia cocleata TaxID=69824 RepID=UPI00242CA42C|nr:energy-coupling factor transporter ATPase [Thomasclavelia cocleata]
MPITFKEIEHIYSENTPFSYHALKGVNLNIKDKSFTAIIGQTGSGKSTLIQHINALLLPASGEINVDEFIITATDKPSKLKPLRKKAGLVFQFPEYQLFEETIEKDIIFGPMNFGVSEEEAKKIASKVLKMVGLNASYLSKSPFELSGGQKRRVAIAGILAMNPDILILDEPTAGLDPQGTSEMMSLFKKINDLGKTIILVTHDMNHVLQYCDEVVVMNHGRVEKHDSVTNIFKDSKYLNSLGIDLPIITDFILKLNNHGFNIDSSINNIDQLILAIGGEING